MPGRLAELATRIMPAARASTMLGWTALMLAAVEARKLADRTLEQGEGQEEIFDRYMRAWTGGLLRTCAVEVSIISPLPRPATGPRMVVSNHRSAVDIPILLTHFGGSVLSRGDVESWPLLGLAAQKAQTIFVDRESSSSGARAIRAIRDQLQRGRTLNVFPEGTTLAGDEVRPFNAGAFAACRKLSVEYVPVGFAYPPGHEFTEEVFVDHVKNVASRRVTRVVMAVGQPRQIEGRAAKVGAALHEEVQSLVHEARQALEKMR